jgi:hypothetical protein
LLNPGTTYAQEVISEATTVDKSQHTEQPKIEKFKIKLEKNQNRIEN